jgi:chromosome segregation ATPase
MLKSLEISGFKSFAKKTELNFQSKITAIVGPNGSGKSNVAEAFRFVLGEQSMKSMRGKRGEDMIWNGSNEIPRANRGIVRIKLQNKDNLFSKISDLSKVGEFEELIIERIVNRDGTNEYLLNGSPVRLKDVIEILAGAHIGSSGHHIISQGEADRILRAGNKERKEMIEDALGLKIYHYKINESERKLEKTLQNIKEVESLRREIAPHLRFLKKQVEKVEKASELRSKLTDFYKEYLKRESLYLDRENSVIQNERNPIENKLRELEIQMKEAKNILASSVMKDEKSDELLNIENDIKEERNKKDGLNREIGIIEGEMSANNKAIEKIQTEQRSEEHKTIPLREVLDLEKEVSILNEVSLILDRIRQFIGRHKSTVDESKLNEYRQDNESLLTKKNKIEISLSLCNSKLNELNDTYQKIKVAIEKDKDSGREAEKNILRIASEQNEYRNRLALINEREKRLKIEEEDWKREVGEAGVLLGAQVVNFETFSLKNVLGLELSNEEIFSEERLKQEERRRELERMKIRLEELGASGGEEMQKEYRDTLERDEYLSKELEDLRLGAETLKNLIDDLLKKLDTEFKTGIEKINKSFEEYFSTMFGGGEAKLKLTQNSKLKIQNLEGEIEEEELIEKEGIEIEVSLPRKRIRGLDMLSGGERALTSIALLFAISQVNPPPFIILDETDAALDEANSKKYGDMIEKLSEVSQLILITHNRETMSRAGIIYGVTMGRDSASRLLSIAFDEAVAVAK